MIKHKVTKTRRFADANCTKVCVYMSLVLLAASLIYELTGFAYIDAIVTVGLIHFSITEATEALEKAKGQRMRLLLKKRNF